MQLITKHDQFNFHMHLKPRIKGVITFFEASKTWADEFQRILEEKALNEDPFAQGDFTRNFLLKALYLKEIDLVASMKNQALSPGVSIYEDLGPSSVSRIVAGNQVSPAASTFTTQTSLQAPLSGLNFPRLGSWSKTNITNGFRWTFAFRRPQTSLPGTQITEMGVQVINGADSALLNRIVQPSSGLPHTFSASADTIGILDFDKVYS